MTNPCIFFKHDGTGNLMMIISTHVDDLLIGRNRNHIDMFYKEFLGHLKLKILGKLKKHLGVWWEWRKDPKTKEIYLKASMPKMLREIKQAFADATGRAPKPAKTPGFPGVVLTKALETKPKVKSTKYHL